MKTALITDVTRQDGAYLAELLLEKGYDVHGVMRRCSLFNNDRIDQLHKEAKDHSRFYLHYRDWNKNI